MYACTQAVSPHGRAMHTTLSLHPHGHFPCRGARSTRAHNHHHGTSRRSQGTPATRRVSRARSVFPHGPKLRLDSCLLPSFLHFCGAAPLSLTPPLPQPFIPKAVCLNKMKIKSLFKPPQAINQQRKRRRGWLWTPFIPESLGLLQ